MKRQSFKKDKIIKDVASRLGDFYSPKQIEQVTLAVLQSLTDAYQRGDVVDFGIGKTFLKLRKNNSNFSPSKTHSIVFRGDVNWEVSSPMIDKALEDPGVFDMLYTRRGSDD